jgi:hypothetical protein
MVKFLTCALVASRTDDGSVFPGYLADSLRIDLSPYPPFGEGGRWQSAGFTICEQSKEPFLHLDEPSEAFFADIRDRLSHFGALLAKADGAALSEFRKKGHRIRVVMEMVIDDNQMELDLPSNLMEQLGRLDIKLSVLTDSI